MISAVSFFESNLIDISIVVFLLSYVFFRFRERPGERSAHLERILPQALAAGGIPSGVVLLIYAFYPELLIKNANSINNIRLLIALAGVVLLDLCYDALNWRRRPPNV